MSLPRALSLALTAALLFAAIAEADTLDSFGDPLPVDAIARFGSVRLHHGQPVSGLAFSADGKKLLSVGCGDTSLAAVRIWNAADGSELRTIHQRFASCAAFSPDGRFAVIGSGVGVVRVWDTSSGRDVQKLAGDFGPVPAVAFSADGKRVFVATSTGVVRAWSAENWQVDGAQRGVPLHRLEGAARTLAVSADGKWLAWSLADGSLLVWREADRQWAFETQLPAGADSLALSADGSLLLAPGERGKLRRWDVKAGKELSSLEAGDKPVQRLAMSADGKTLAAASDGIIRLWDVDKEKVVREIARPSGDVPALALSPDGTVVAAAGPGCLLHVWDVATGKERIRNRGHTEAVTRTAFSPKGDIAATASEDGTIRIWDAASGKELRTCDGKGLWPLLLAFTPDGATLVSGGEGGEIRFWDANSGKEKRRIGKVEDAVAICAALSSDGKTLALAGKDNRIRLFDAAQGLPGPILEGHEKRICSIAFSPDCRTLATAGVGEAVRVWDMEKGREKLRIAELTDATALALGPKGRMLAAGRPDGVVGLWDATTGKVIRLTPGHAGPVASLAFSADGWFLASCGTDHTPRVWETATGQEVFAPEGHGGPVRCVAFSSHGRTLLSGGDDATALLWDVTGARGDGLPRRDRLTPGELSKLWIDLVGDDGHVANRALWDLAAAREQSLPFLHDRLQSLLGPDGDRVVRLIAQLDDDDFDVRERASADLAALGQAVAPSLKEALRRAVSTEVRQRLQLLLGRLKDAPPWEQERGRVLRALAVLERCGTPAARELLAAIAKAAPAEEVRQTAREAVERLDAAKP